MINRISNRTTIMQNAMTNPVSIAIIDVFFDYTRNIKNIENIDFKVSMDTSEGNMRTGKLSANIIKYRHDTSHAFFSPGQRRDG